MRHPFLIVRHTPAFNFVHRFAIGTASGRSDSEAMNKNKEAGCVALSDIASEDENGNKKKGTGKAEKSGRKRPKTAFPLIINQINKNQHRNLTASFPDLQGTNSGRCTIYVQYLYNICTFTIVQVLYNYCTYIVQRPVLVRERRHPCLPRLRK